MSSIMPCKLKLLFSCVLFFILVTNSRTLSSEYDETQLSGDTNAALSYQGASSQSAIIDDREETEALERTKAAVLRQKRHNIVDNIESSKRVQLLNENLREQKKDEQLKAMYADARAHADNMGRYVNDISELTRKDLLWISTIEGLTAHYDMMKRFWAWAVASGRNLVVASYKSAHYPGVKSVDICSIFNLPESIKCIGIRRNLLVQRLKCTVAPEEPDKSPGDYGLHSNFSMTNLPLVDWNNSECVIGTGRSKFFMGLPGAKTHLKIQFSEKSVTNYEKSFDMLFAPGPTGGRNDYTVAHWRRSFMNQHTNAPCRHNSKDDEIINCGNPENLVSAIKNVNFTKIGRVYVSTNERRPIMLETLRKAGLKLLADTRNRVVGGQKLSSLDAFIVDVQMMIQADHYMSWGKSAVRSFVERARIQRAKLIVDQLKKKKQREEAEAESRSFIIIVALPVVFILLLVYLSYRRKKNQSALPTTTHAGADGIDKGKKKEPHKTMEDRLKAGKFIKSKGLKGLEKQPGLPSTINRKNETMR